MATQAASSPLLSLSAELRNLIYELVLLEEEPIDPSVPRARRESPIGFLSTSRAIHREASAMFYGQNQFDFTSYPARSFIVFLERIGRNARYIRDLRIDFPRLSYRNHVNDDGEEIVDCHSEVEVSPDRAELFTTIRKRCASIHKLTIGPIDDSDLWGDYSLARGTLPHQEGTAKKALVAVDAQLRAIPTVTDITMTVVEGTQAARYSLMMEEYGWNVETNIEHSEEESEDSQAMSVDSNESDVEGEQDGSELSESDNDYNME